MITDAKALSKLLKINIFVESRYQIILSPGRSENI
jgi:hypothetical protein